ncbi:MAG: methyltransferase domain-containing protein [Proteobacteria bacterium]|nr:methyltransferase domain-containing protein [Pseudomonadota bacterium]
MTHSNADAAPLLVENLPLFKSMNFDNGVLDLACGTGRNGLLLASINIPVTFADNSKAAIHRLTELLAGQEYTGECWLVDLEQDVNPLAGKEYDGVLVFNYLHRPLFGAIRAAIRPGGLIFYETFTVKQCEYGKPSNPDFLLQPSELRDCFDDWEILHYFEGERVSPRRAIASLIARRPQLGHE